MSRKPRIRPTFRVWKEGLGQVLGDLEKVIMETLWKLDRPSTVSEVQSAMGGESRAYHTVTTVMTRLCDKTLLARKKVNDVWHYSPTLSQEEFRQHVTREVIASAYELAPAAAVNSMLDLVDASGPEALDRLAKLIQEKREAKD